MTPPQGCGIFSVSFSPQDVAGRWWQIETTTTYFETPGKGNTEEVLRLVRKRVQELGIKAVVIASTGGDTAAKATELLGGIKVIAVGLSAGWSAPPGHATPRMFTAENRQKIESAGGAVLTTTHAFAGIDHALRAGTGTSLLNIIARTLNIFCHGMKVVCEIAVMAADAGLIRTDEDVIVIAGTGRGADTAVVLRPTNSTNFFDMRVKEVLCKPHYPAPHLPAPAGQAKPGE
ncbi:MAG: hypothetical protein HYX84_00040 [Chloroflexi bacterium]|nr:hypothetical protein [Chloroflexota bacterium]